MLSLQAEKRRLKNNLFIPILLVSILWLIKLVELTIGFSFFRLGILPRDLSGILGIFTSPFIHGDLSHLFSNTFPLIVLGFLILQSYKQIAYKLVALVCLGGGLFVWLLGNPFSPPSYHIGASGLIYGLAFFIFFSGVFRKDIRSIALALIVVMFYGGIIWGLLPIQEGVSWEGHLGGALMGILGAYFFKGINPPQRFIWDDQEEEDKDIVEDPFWMPKQTESIEIPIENSDAFPLEVKYHFKPKEEN